MSTKLSVNEAKAIVASANPAQGFSITVTLEENNGCCVVFRDKLTGYLLWKLSSTQLAEFKIDFESELKSMLGKLNSVLLSDRHVLKEESSMNSEYDLDLVPEENFDVYAVQEQGYQFAKNGCKGRPAINHGDEIELLAFNAGIGIYNTRNGTDFPKYKPVVAGQ